MTESCCHVADRHAALARRLERETRYLKYMEICLGVCRRTLYGWIRAGKFPSHELEVGTVRRWRLSTVAEWEAAHSREAPEELRGGR